MTKSGTIDSQSLLKSILNGMKNGETSLHWNIELQMDQRGFDFGSAVRSDISSALDLWIGNYRTKRMQIVPTPEKDLTSGWQSDFVDNKAPLSPTFDYSKSEVEYWRDQLVFECFDACSDISSALDHWIGNYRTKRMRIVPTPEEDLTSGWQSELVDYKVLLSPTFDYSKNEVEYWRDQSAFECSNACGTTSFKREVEYWRDQSAFECSNAYGIKSIQAFPHRSRQKKDYPNF
ncbi:unnamed protein product [Caenorhabditis brenneri]